MYFSFYVCMFHLTKEYINVYKYNFVHNTSPVLSMCIFIFFIKSFERLKKNNNVLNRHILHNKYAPYMDHRSSKRSLVVIINPLIIHYLMVHFCLISNGGRLVFVKRNFYSYLFNRNNNNNN